MSSRVAILFGLAVAAATSTPLLAQTIPCENSSTNECTSAPTCQTNGTCRGVPINEGQPCTQEATSSGCMTNPVCKKGVCTGTVPVADGTECNFAGLEKCYSPGHCKSIPLAGLSFCTLGTPKSCPPPSDPCTQSACNPQTGDCIEGGDKCVGSFFGCEVCDAGTCRAVNTGGPCTNPDGDFNECTVDDRCVLLASGSLAEFSSATDPRLPPALAAAMRDKRQAVPISFCKGVPGVGPTPTVGPEACVGDCDGNRTVSVNELVTMVNIALDNDQVSSCMRGDPNGSDDIRIDEILTAVNNALNGCG